MNGGTHPKGLEEGRRHFASAMRTAEEKPTRGTHLSGSPEDEGKVIGAGNQALHLCFVSSSSPGKIQQSSSSTTTTIILSSP